MENKLQGCRVLVLGMGRSGCAAARLLLHRKAVVTGIDAKITALQSSPEISFLLSQGLSVASDDAVDTTCFDLIVSSPGVSPNHPVLQCARQHGVPCLGEIGLALRCLPKTQRCLGITGTNGKTTVTLMVSHVLNACGIRARAVGNVGVALCGEIDQGLADDVLVLELSSYQLEPLQERVLDAGIILNITPDHLDRHGIMEAYAAAKLGIARCLKPGGVLYVNKQTRNEFPSLFENLCSCVYDQGGSHDEENRQAAQCLCAVMGVTEQQFSNAVASFRKPPHRIEFVRCCGGVNYYDDSKGTNIDAVARAVTALPGKIVLIAGGVDKGASYSPWIPVFRDKVRAIYAIGQAAPKMKNELAAAFPVEIESCLENAVKKAAMTACPGESVLLSPGCSSFDMFRDYEHRGEEFKKFVFELTERT